jgi:hypothetical protein
MWTDEDDRKVEAFTREIEALQVRLGFSSLVVLAVRTRGRRVVGNASLFPPSVGLEDGELRDAVEMGRRSTLPGMIAARFDALVQESMAEHGDEFADEVEEHKAAFLRGLKRGAD